MNWKICRISIVFGTLLIGTLIPICDASAAWRWRRARRSAATYNQNACCCNQAQYGGYQYGGAYSQPTYSSGYSQPTYGSGYSSTNYGHVQSNCGCSPMVAVPTGAQVNDQFGNAYPVTGAQSRTIDATGTNSHFNTTRDSGDNTIRDNTTRDFRDLNQPQQNPIPTDNLNQKPIDSGLPNNPVQTNELEPVLENATGNR